MSDEPSNPNQPSTPPVGEQPTRPARPAYGEYAPTPTPGADETPAAPAGQVPPGAPSSQPGSGPSRGPVTNEPAPAISALPNATGAWSGGGWPQTLATYTRYEDAQAAVDLLSDEGFPVEAVSIVGHDIRTVENVSGRLTSGKAAVRGLGGGAWFGLLLGLLFSIFAPGAAWLGILLLAVGLGALWGALFGFVGHAAQRGRRDFSSVKTMEAGRYDVLVRGELAARAQQVMAQGRGVRS
ncbi:general stress protein [Frigoribacterium sp. 2-23]|uniref:general stress protein n=1 Tax=Frigoribacterium sp. 2-23 TaxID=3415006 RepID=UPI003C700392